MIYSKSYEILIRHEKSEITILNETNNKSVYKVYILSKDKKKYYYIWQIEKVLQNGNLDNCWMTTSVSSSEYIGNIIWAMSSTIFVKNAKKKMKASLKI
mgnify:CR=1 FL=1|jgi:hypothetical protein